VIVLDTHAWIWFVDQPEQLSAKAYDLVSEAKKQRKIYLSSISTWEICMLEKKGKLKFKIAASLWVQRCERLGIFRFVPVDNEITKTAVHLPEPLHRDPADRMIIATAKVLGMPVMTKDKKITLYPDIETTW